MNSFEIVVNEVEGEGLKIDHDYFTTRRDQCKLFII